MTSKILKNCGIALAKEKLTIAFAESATAGRAAYEFSLLPESGKILKGGLVCYDAELKESILKISPDFVKRFTPESAEVTQEIANQLPLIIDSDVQVGITGLTTPGGSENEEKPVGTMFVCVIVRGKPVIVRKVFTGAPEKIIAETVDLVAETILSQLSKN